MSKRPQDTSAEEPNGGNLHVRLRRGPGRGNRPGLLNNKVWLVTGSSSGLGRNIAEAVLESGDRLVATARDTKRLDDLVKKYGDRVRAVPLDVTDESATQAAVQTAVADLRPSPKCWRNAT